MPVTANAIEAIDSAFAAAGRIVRRADRDAYLTSFFLPKRKRQAVWAVLAFCQMIREAIASSEPTLENARGMREHPAVVSPQHVAAISSSAASACGCGSEVDERVAMFRDRLAEIYEGRVELPALATRSDQQHAIEAVGRVLRELQIPRQLFLDFAGGLRDGQRIRRYATWNSLQKHLHGTGGVVGVIISGVLGVTHSDAAVPAASLGCAIRLTSILQHLTHDLLQGIIYLPLEDLVRSKATEHDLLTSAEALTKEPDADPEWLDRMWTTPDNVCQLVSFEVDRARELLRTASRCIHWLADDGSRLATSAVVVRCSAMLDRLKAAGFDAFRANMNLGTGRKLRLLSDVWRLARRG